MQESFQKFISRNRPPRVHITYEPSVGEPEVEIPFVLGVMADLSGMPEEELPSLLERKFKDVDAESFDQFLKSTKPRIVFNVPNRLTDEGGEIKVELTFESMDDFLPDAIAQRVEPLRKIYEARTKVDNMLTWIDGREDAQKLIARLFEKDESGDLVNKELIEGLAAKGEEPPAS